jgi:Importin-beta N-terminal domain
MAAGTPDITAVLQAAQSPDANQRQQAEQQLKQAEEQNAAGYLATLSGELANTDKPADVRQIAGILLKNALDAPGADAGKKVPAAVHERWPANPPQHADQALQRAAVAFFDSYDVAAPGTAGTTMAAAGGRREAAHQAVAAGNFTSEGGLQRSRYAAA